MTRSVLSANMGTASAGTGRGGDRKENEGTGGDMFCRGLGRHMRFYWLKP